MSLDLFTNENRYPVPVLVSGRYIEPSHTLAATAFVELARTRKEMARMSCFAFDKQDK